MVMGSFRLLIETALRIFASARFFTLLWIFLFVFAAQEGTSKTCRVDECTTPYKRSTNHLEAASEKNPTVNLSKKRCRVLKRLHRCLHRQRRICRGNLLYHSLKPIGDKQLREANCSRKSGRSNSGTKRGSGASRITEKPKINHNISVSSLPLVRPVKDGACVYSGTSKYKHCGMFGDPHLRTFSDVFNTCKVQGTWILIDNDYLMVMVTNVPVKNGSSATATTKITVQFYAFGTCAVNTPFVAKSGQLPGAFVDGSSVAGSLEVAEIQAWKHVELYARHIGTTIIIRQVGRYLTFAIQMPEEFITSHKSPNQLCVRGCPSTDQLFPAKTGATNSPDRPVHADPFPATNLLNSSYKHLKQNEDESLKLEEQAASLPYFSEKEARARCKQVLLGLNAVTMEKNFSKPANETKPPRRKKNTQAKLSESDLIHSSFKQLRGIEETDFDLSLRKNRKQLRDLDKTGSLGKSSKRRSRRETLGRRKRSGTRRKSRKCVDETRKPTNFYFDSCVFDLITTGDVGFAEAAKAAWDDVKRTHALTYNAPSSSVEVITRWQPYQKEPDCERSNQGGNKDEGGGSQSNRSTTLLVIFCAVSTCLYLNLASSSVFNYVTVNSTKRKDTTRFRDPLSNINLNANRAS